MKSHNSRVFVFAAWYASLLAATIATPSHAETMSIASTAPHEAPVVQSLADEPYAADPAFHGGQFIEDAFSTDQADPTSYQDGKKVVRLGNGDLVTAALVKNPYGNQTNGRWNLGLVRHNAAGTQRLTWANAGPYAHAGGEYVVFPKTDTANYSWIQDIKAVDDKILVALNLNFGGSDDIDTIVLVFGQDGSYKSSTSVFGSGQAEYVGGMEVYDIGQAIGPQVVVVATQAPRESAGGGNGRPLFRRYALSDSGALADQTGVVNLATHWCDNAARNCRPAGIALGYRGLLSAPAIYVVNRYYQTAADQPGWSIAVTKVDGNGVADPAWPGLWWYFRDGDGSGAHYTLPVAIAVRTTGVGLPASPYRDSVFVASEIERSCGNGILVTRFNDVHDWTGQVVFGGSTASGSTCTVLGQPTDWPVDLAISGDRLAVVGYGKYSPLGGGEDVTDAFIAVLDTDGPTLLDLRDYRYPINATRERHSGFWGVTPTTAGHFVAVGDVRYPQTASVPTALRGKTAVAVLGIATDRIMGNGFE